MFMAVNDPLHNPHATVGPYSEKSLDLLTGWLSSSSRVTLNEISHNPPATVSPYSRVSLGPALL